METIEKVPTNYVSNLPEEIREPIVQYYDVAGMDYAEWSKNFNMHFGYYRKGINPFNLEDMLQEMNNQVLKTLTIPENIPVRILDMGCGMGEVARHLAKKLPLAEILGITIVDSQIEKGTQITQQQNLTNQVQLLKCNFEDSFFASNSMDYAYAVESSCYAQGKDKAKLIKETYRVLQDGGRCVFCDGFLKTTKPLPWLINKAYRRLCKSWALPDMAEIHLFTQQMKEAGFKNIQIRDISWNVAPSVLFIPWVTFKFLFKQLFIKRIIRLEKERWDNVISPALTMFTGLCRSYFSYYIVSAEK